ncbi:MAG: hypothetical protein ACI4UK_06370 [Floccifex sp.]
MKKKIMIIVIVVVLVLAGLWLAISPKALGNMKHSYDETTTSSSNFSFSGQENERIKFSFASNIESGNLVVTLRDSAGDVVYELDDAKRLETFYTLNATDTYMVVAEYENFVGNFKVTVYPAK